MNIQVLKIARIALIAIFLGMSYWVAMYHHSDGPSYFFLCMIPLALLGATNYFIYQATKNDPR